MNDTIIYMGGFELPDKNAAAHRVIHNAKALRETGKKVVLIGIAHGTAYQTDVCDTKTIMHGFECYALPYPDSFIQWKDYLTQINRYLEIFQYYSDIGAVILYDFPSVALSRMIRYGRKKGIRCYADITEWYSARGRGLLYAVVKGCDTCYRMRILHKRMDGLIVISRYLQNYYKNMKTIARIPPLTDIRESRWSNPYPKSKDRLLLVYAGDPGRKDRIDILIDALQTVRRPYRLDVIGITLEGYLKRAGRHRKLLDQNPCICFHGRKTHPDTLEYVKKANYSCFFREADRVCMAGFPTKFVEAVSCGTPVLTNDTSDLAACCADGKNGYVLDGLDIQEISRVIEQLPFIMETEAGYFDYRQYVRIMERF